MGSLQRDKAFQHTRCRDRHNCRVHIVRKIANGPQSGQTVNRVSRGVNRHDLPGELPFQEIIDDDIALRSALRGRADDGDRFRPNKGGDVADQSAPIYAGRTERRAVRDHNYR